MTLEERGYIVHALRDVISHNVKQERERIIKILEAWGEDEGFMVGHVIEEIRGVEE